MTSHDPVLAYSHDSLPAPSRRRRSQSTASTRSTSKRSPSPIVAFSPTTPLSPESGGVQKITRKVIRTLEGFGHLDDMEEQECESNDLSEVEEHLNGHAHETNGHQNGVANGNSTKVVPASKAPPAKIDWEIPRKVLHSSIGFFTIYLYVSERDPSTVILVLWSALCVIVPADIIRLRSPGFERIYEKFLGFLMRESEKKKSNGVIWYILGVNIALTFYPLDVATVAILILSWADTTASTFGRMFGYLTPRLPTRTPVLGLPLAPRKSLAGFIAATITGALIAFTFWGWVSPIRFGGAESTWQWDGGVNGSTGLLSKIGLGSFTSGGLLGLGAISTVAGLVSGVAEALDLGSLDDNLTLPIISGGCILGFLKLMSWL